MLFVCGTFLPLASSFPSGCLLSAGLAERIFFIMCIGIICHLTCESDEISLFL